jgi:hypothetical protein
MNRNLTGIQVALAMDGQGHANVIWLDQGLEPQKWRVAPIEGAVFPPGGHITDLVRQTDKVLAALAMDGQGHANAIWLDQGLEPQKWRVAPIEGAVFPPGGHITDLVRQTGAVPSGPSRLQFRLRDFAEGDSTDSGLQGASDEVFLSALGLDSATVQKGPDGKPVVDLIRTPVIGDISEDSVHIPWRNNPHVLLEFDLHRQGDWPRTYTTTLLIVEEDNENLAKAFDQLNAQVGAKVREEVVKAAIVAIEAAGKAIGNLIPGIGTAVGAALGALGPAGSALAGEVFDAIISAIRSGLGNDVFTPRILTLTVPDPTRIREQPDIDHAIKLRIEEHGAIYEVVYDWHVVD